MFLLAPLARRCSHGSPQSRSSLVLCLRGLAAIIPRFFPKSSAIIKRIACSLAMAPAALRLFPAFKIPRVDERCAFLTFLVDFGGTWEGMRGQNAAMVPTSKAGRTAGASRRRGPDIRDQGGEAYGEPRQRQRDVVLLDGTTHAGRTPAHWRRVALIFAKRTGHWVGLDTATRMASDADFSPGQKPDDPRAHTTSYSTLPLGRIEAHSFSEVRVSVSSFLWSFADTF